MIILVGINWIDDDIIALRTNEFFSKGNIINFHKFKPDEDYQIQEILNNLKSKINKNRKYEEKLKFFQDLHQTYLKNSIEKNLKLFPDYVNKISKYLFSNEDELKTEFSDFEKMSFNSNCISDESILILQVLCIKRASVQFSLNSLQCHICKTKLTSIPRIILSNCNHCYCNDCMIDFCNTITKSTMKTSDFKLRELSANCLVQNCQALVSINDATKCGALFQTKDEQEELYKKIEKMNIISEVGNLISNLFGKKNSEEIKIENKNSCKICNTPHEENLIQLFCCSAEICHEGLLDSISESIEKGMDPEKINCPNCGQLLGSYIIEYLIGEEEFNKRFNKK
jgi:hypothetical protein